MKNFNFKKSLGQNFLIDNNVIHNIVEKSCVDKDTFLIEVGPGGGAITKYIVPKCRYALLYEVDERLEENLNNILVGNDNYSIIIKDFLKVNLESDLANYDYDKLYVVANLPYYITTPIIMKFIDSECLPDKFVIMIQKEVANRLASKPGNKDYGSLTVFLNYYYDIHKLFDVSKNCYNPKPNVDSAVIEMNLKKDRLYVKDISLFKKIVKDSFRYRRKTIRNNLSGYDLDIISKVLSKYGYDLGVRAEYLKLDIFVEITNLLTN